MTVETKTELQKALGSFRAAFYAAGAFSFITNLLLFVAPLYMLQVYDRVLSSRSEMTLLMLTIIAAVLMAMQGLLEFARSRILVRVGVMLDERLSSRVFGALFQQSVTQSTTPQPLSDLSTLREFLTGPGFITLCDLPWAPIFIAVGFIFHPALGWMCLFAAVVLFILAIVNDAVTKDFLKEATKENIVTANFVQASMRNSEVLSAMGMLSGIFGRYQHRHRRVLALQAFASDRAGLLIALSKFLRTFLQSAVLGLGAYLAIHQEISPGVIIATSIILGRALAPIDAAVGYWKGFIAARGAWGRLSDMLKSFPPEPERMPLPKPKGALRLETVVAAAPNSMMPILKGINLSIDAGTTIGILGASGAGKSTLARVVTGVWSTRNGVVRLDGSDIRNWAREDLGPHIGYLPQDVELFDGTVAENIARLREVEADAVIEAAKNAGVHEVVLALPAGYDTVIGVGGSMLSGGQRQRIGLARALYRCPPLIVLDEPNSNLDAAGEEALLHAIEEMKRRGSTVVIITHRLNILNAVDALVVMRDGAIDVSGPRDAVIAHLNGQTQRLPQPFKPQVV